MPEPEIRELRYFRAVAEALHITRAAEHAEAADNRAALGHAYFLLHVNRISLGEKDDEHARLALPMLEEAGDLVLVVGERERHRAGAVGDGNALGFDDPLQAAFEGLGMDRAGGKQRGEGERDRAKHQDSRIGLLKGAPR